MSGYYAGWTRPALRGVADEPDQVPRMQQFRAAHPTVIIGTDQFGTWQGRIPEENGETVITRHRLCELLDKLAELIGERPRSTGQRPRIRKPAAVKASVIACSGRGGGLDASLHVTLSITVYTLGNESFAGGRSRLAGRKRGRGAAVY